MADVVLTVAELDALDRKYFLRLNGLRKENRYCDVRLDVNGKIFPCHRLVLTASSEYFDTMFNSEFKESTSNTILLKDMETEAFEEILNAIYTREVRLLPSNVYFILKIGHFLLLESVVEACLSYIKENCNTIHYLIETCLFLDTIDQIELYSKCIKEIAEDLTNYSKTDSFKSIPMKDLKLILSISCSDNDDEESIVLLILEWSKIHEASSEDIEELLELARLRTNNTINPALMAQFMIHMGDTFLKSFNSETNKNAGAKSSLDLNLYLNVVDVKTGQKGWSVLKVNDKFDSFVVSSFQPTYSSSRKVCTIESQLYCFEYFVDQEKRNVFSTYDENNLKIILPTPEEIIQNYEIVTKGTKIYVVSNDYENERFIMWTYDCASKVWLNKSQETSDLSCGRILECTFSNGVFYVIGDPEGDRSDLRLYSINKKFSEIVELEILPQFYEENIIYAFSNKIVLFGRDSNDRTHFTYIFDLTSEEWLDDRSRMSVSRTQFQQVIHHDGFLYVIENTRNVKNEKYDLNSNKWLDLPQLPKRVTFVNKDGDVRVLATGTVFGSEIIPE